MELIMGIYDAPEAQMQPQFCVNPLRSHIAVFGSPMSGKTTFVKTLLMRLHEGLSQKQEEIHIIDFGGSLGLFKNLPNICAYFDNTSEENIKRVFRTIEKKVADNAKKLEGRNFPEVWKKQPDRCPPHLTFIIENVTGFLADERYDSYRDTLTKLCRDGLSKGLTIVITGGETSGMGKLIPHFAQKIGFGLSAEQYSEVFGGKVLPPMRLPGRGIANIEGKHGSRNYEFQGYLPFEGPEEEALRPLLAAPANAKRMGAFPEVLLQSDPEVSGGDLPRLEADQMVVGLDYYDHKRVIWDHSRSRCVGIYGKRSFGKTNLLKVMLAHLRKRFPDHRFVYLDDGRLQLRRILRQPFDEKNAEKTRDQERQQLKDAGYIQFPTGEIYLTDVDRFQTFLTVNKYCAEKKEKKPPAPVGALNTAKYGDLALASGETKQQAKTGEMKPLPQADGRNTVFIIDNKSFYPRGFTMQASKHALSTPMIETLVNAADDNDNVFILADIRKLEAEHSETLSRILSMAFLLDNIGEFVSDRGSKSVFGEMDAKELKSLYARCEIGDGYCYKIEEDELVKLKFLKAQE